nr:hypothetical protein CFP56_72631 [Quercus suber]
MDGAGIILPERRITRTAQACERCRSLKARCLPSSRQGFCRRCVKSGIICIWAEGRQKKRRHGASKKLSRYQHSPAAEHGSVSGTNLAARSSVGGGETGPISAVGDQHSQLHPCEVPHSLNEMSNLHDFDLTAEDGRSSVTKIKKSSMDEQFGASLAAQPEAGELLDEYRRMQHSFPFVPVTTEMTVQSLSQEKPMMLLAIMTVSSWRYRSTQMRLEKRFRTELADRTIVNPRKDLELLQGMLVYLAWPTHLKFYNNMTHWCRRFSEQPELESDKTIELLIESRRILDSIHENSVASDQWHPALMEDRILKPFKDSKLRFTYWDTQPQRKEHRRRESNKMRRIVLGYIL